MLAVKGQKMFTALDFAELAWAMPNSGKISENEHSRNRSKYMSFERARRAESNGKKFFCGLNYGPRYKDSKWSNLKI